MSKIVVIVEVLVAQAHGVDTSGDHFLGGVLDQIRAAAMIGDARHELTNDTCDPFGLPQPPRTK